MSSSKASSRQKPTTPEGKFSKAISDILAGTSPTKFVIPTLAADPPETDPTNLWMRYDGRLRGRFWNGTGYTYVDYPMRTDITSPPAVPAYPARPAQPAAPTTRSKSYAAIWTQSYNGDGSQRTDALGTTNVIFGNINDGLGRQKSLIGFDYATIATDLTGSTVKRVDYFMQNLDSYRDSGVDVYFGIHNVTALPSTWPDASLPQRMIKSYHFGNPQNLTVQLPIIFATGIRDGSGKGIALEAPSDSPDFFGYGAGVGSGYSPPILTITYAK
jgi:hypothetical protein